MNRWGAWGPACRHGCDVRHWPRLQAPRPVRRHGGAVPPRDGAAYGARSRASCSRGCPSNGLRHRQCHRL